MGEAARRADATIVISPHQHDEAVRLLGLDPTTVHLLPDGVDVERFAVRRSDDRRATRALARLARARSAGLGRGEQDAGEHPLQRGRGRRRVLRREHRRVAPRPDVRRALPGLQARAVARARVRPRPGAHVRPGSARDLGRRAGRMGGRAPAQRRHPRGRERRLLRRVARPRRPAASASRAPTASSPRPRPSRSDSSTSRRWPAGSP